MVRIISLVCINLFLLNKHAFAYIDPGSASLAIQGILAAIAGGFATIKLWGSKIKSFFRSNKKDEEKK